MPVVGNRDRVVAMERGYWRARGDDVGQLAGRVDPASRIGVGGSVLCERRRGQRDGDARGRRPERGDDRLARSVHSAGGVGVVLGVTGGRRCEQKSDKKAIRAAYSGRI